MIPANVYPLVLRVITLVSEGKTLTRACREAGISIGAFKARVRGDKELQELHEEAEQQGYDTLAELLLEIDSDSLYGSTDPKQQKVMSDNIKWFLSRRRPNQYGERVTVRHELTADRAIIEALEAGKQRALGAVEDAAYTMVEERLIPPTTGYPAQPVQVAQPVYDLSEFL